MVNTSPEATSNGAKNDSVSNLICTQGNELTSTTSIRHNHEFSQLRFQPRRECTEGTLTIKLRNHRGRPGLLRRWRERCAMRTDSYSIRLSMLLLLLLLQRQAKCQSTTTRYQCCNIHSQCFAAIPSVKRRTFRRVLASKIKWKYGVL